tara:strand:- start:1083 stop:1412 length:330 start_codon:yes stop_codon:yes gene_type:complete
MSNYGKSGKKIVFYDSDKRHADLKIRLHYDGLTQSAFFRGIVSGYLNQDEDLMSYIHTLKSDLGAQSASKKNKIKNVAQAREETINKFALKDTEIESIFDILEEEGPEL